MVRPPDLGGINLLLVLCLLLSLTLVFTLPRVSARLDHSGPDPRPSRRTVGGLYAGGILSLALLVVVLSYVAPVAYIYAITEDYWVEHATFVAFMLAGGFFLWAAVLEPDYRRLGPLAFALAAVFVGMEEVSWGQRIVGFETPELLEAYNYQGELTLHNIWFPRHTVVGTVVMLFGVLVPTLGRRWSGLGELIRRMAVPLPRPLLQPLFLVAGALLVYSNYQPSFMKIDEVGELALGIAVLLLGLDLAMKAGRGRWATRRRLTRRSAGLSKSSSSVWPSIRWHYRRCVGSKRRPMTCWGSLPERAGLWTRQWPRTVRLSSARMIRGRRPRSTGRWHSRQRRPAVPPRPCVTQPLPVGSRTTGSCTTGSSTGPRSFARSRRPRKVSIPVRN
jgi:hypothetical protein